MFTGSGSTLILNSQIYGRPMHKGNFTLDAFHPPSNLEFIANAQYVGVNNSQHLAPYVNFSFGITHPLGIGMLTLFETNAFNNQTALFSTINGAQPQPLVGGGYLLVAGESVAAAHVSDFVFDQYRRAQGRRLCDRRAQRRRAARASAICGESGAECRARRGGWFHRRARVRRAALRRAAVQHVDLGGRDRPSRMHGRFAAACDGRARATRRGGECVCGRHDAVARGHRHHVDAARRALGHVVLCTRPEHPARALPASARRRSRRQQRSATPAARRFRWTRWWWSAADVPIADHGGAECEPERDASPRPVLTPSPALIAALQPFKALVSCAYATVLTPDDAKTRGFDVPAPGVPGPRPSPPSSPAPGASPAPRTPRAGGGAGFINYAPSPGFFVVRVPDLGTGGGSVKQP